MSGDSKLEPSIFLEQRGSIIDVDFDVDESTLPVVYVGEEHGEIAVPIEMLLVGNVLDIYPEIKAQGIFQFRFDGKRMVFQAGRYVGLIPINTRVTIEVRPRVPLRSLEELLISSGVIPRVLSGFTRRFESYERPFDGLLDILTDAFLEALEPIRNFGLYKEYERREALSTQPKGRLNLAKIAQRAFTSPYDLRIACSWYERVVDNAVNRCLLTTLELLAVKYLRLFRAKGALSRIKRINEAAGLFRGVSTESSFAFMSDIYVSDAAKLPALRSYYAEPLLLAKAIIQSQGVSLSSSGDEFSLSSLLVDMSTVFEAYLRNSLISEFSSGEVFVVDGNRREDIGGGARALFASDNRQRLGKIPMATPDMVVYKRDKDNAKVEIVIDAKYKLPDPVAEREDINQVVTYATAYGTQKALLVMPYHEGTKAGLWYVGRVGAVHVYQYNIDLAAVDGVAERKRWCAAIQALAVRPAEFIF